MPKGYDLRLLSYAIAVAEEGSVSAAARRLSLSQPTLSRQLRDLEHRLGVALFVRSGRQMVPTAAGKAAVWRAKRVLAEADAVLDDARLAARGRIGRLTIAFVGSAINGALGKALGRLRTELPDVDLRLVELLDDVDLSSGVLDGSFDVAVHRFPLHDARLRTQLWIREPLTAFLPATHPLATTRKPATVAMLRDIPLVLWRRETAARAYDDVIALFHHAGIVPRIGMFGHAAQTILALVAAGFGAAIMADSYRVLRREGVTPRRLTGTSTAVYLVSRADDTNPLLSRLWPILHDGKSA